MGGMVRRVRRRRSRDEAGRWRKRRGRRSSREGKEIVAVAREEVERGNRAGFVDQGHVRRGQRHRGNDSNCRRAAPGAGARTVVFPGPVIRGRRVLHRRVVRVVLARRLLRGSRVDTAMHRATHRPLGPAHEERKPERQHEGESPKGQRTVHCED